MYFSMALRGETDFFFSAASPAESESDDEEEESGHHIEPSVKATFEDG